MKIPLSVQQLLEGTNAAQEDNSRFKNKKKPSNSLDRKSSRKAARTEVKTKKRARHSVPPIPATAAKQPPFVAKKKNPVPVPQPVVVKKKKEKSEQAKMESLLISNPQFHKLISTNGSDPSVVDQDEMNMRYYAKKLGIKQAGSIPQSLHDDGLGFLFKGITIPGMETSAKEEEEEESEDEEVMGDLYMESDTEELLMEDQEEPLEEEMDIEMLDGSSSDEEATDRDFSSREEQPEEIVKETSASKYVPPHLRKAQNADPATESRSRVKRALIGPLNRLNSTNLETISVEIELVLLKNTRNGIYFLCLTSRCDG
jgi:nucleolar MIF4G domain-containing protein 1